MTDRALPLLGLLVAGAVAALLVARGEGRIAEGETVYLELGPVDPRAPLVGDFMALDHAVAREAAAAMPSSGRGLAPPRVERGEDVADVRGADEQLWRTGAPEHLIVRLDARGVASFVGFQHGDEPLAEDERLLRFEIAGAGVEVGSDAWYFQEGEAEVYAPARYGCYRLAPDGSVLLVGMADEALAPLGPPRSRW